MRSRWIGFVAGIALVANVATAVGTSRPVRRSFLNLTQIQRRATAAAQMRAARSSVHHVFFAKPNRVSTDQSLLNGLLVNGSNPASFTIGDTIQIQFNYEPGEMMARIVNYLDLDGDSLITAADEQVMDRFTVIDNGPFDEDSTLGVFSAHVPSLELFPVVGSYILEVSNGISAATCYITVSAPPVMNYSISGVVVEPPNTAGIVVLANFGGPESEPDIGSFVAAVTDSNGAFTIPVPDFLAGDTATVVAVDFLGVTDNYVASQPQMVPVFGNVSGLNLVMMPANAWVRVRLTDQFGNPVVGVRVYLEADGPGTQARTDSSGIAVLGGFPGPWYNIYIEEDDLWPNYLAGGDNTSSFTLVAGDTTDVAQTVYANDSSIEGTVSISGQPAVGFEVGAWSPEGHSWGYTDYSGSFSIPVYSGIQEGYWVGLEDELIPPGYFARFPEGAIPAGTTGVHIELWPAPSTIYGYVTDAATGQPIEHAWVEARNDSCWLGDDTDESGYYEIPISNGTYQVQVWVEGYLPQADTVTVINDSVQVDFALQPFVPAAIQGTVRDQMGNPIAGVHVWARCDSPAYMERDAWTDLSGYYEVGDLPPGRYIVEAYGDLWARQFYDHVATWDSASYVYVGAGQTVSGIDFDLFPGGAIQGTVRDAETGEPLAGAHIRAEVISDSLSPWTYWFETWVESGADGQYTIGGLPPGKYLVQADKMEDGYMPELYNGHWPWEEPDTVVVVTGSYTSSIDFDLIRGCALGGTVFDSTWMPVDSATVVAETIDGAFHYEAHTDSSGQFMFAPIEPGAYQVYVTAPGYDTTWYAGPDTMTLVRLNPGEWSIFISIVLGGTGTETGVTGQGLQAVPKDFALQPAYPNPFNPETTIEYDVPKAARVQITVFDALGRRVITLVDRTVSPGRHRVVWRGVDDTGRPVGSGVYVVALRAGERRFVNKVLLLK